MPNEPGPRLRHAHDCGAFCPEGRDLPPRLVHAARAARELGVTLATVRAWIRRGKLAGTKGPGRWGRYMVTRESLDACAKGDAPADLSCGGGVGSRTLTRGR